MYNTKQMSTAFVVMGATPPVSRRTALRLAGLAVASVCVPRPGGGPAWALKPGKPSKEKLLNSIREEKTPEEMEAEKERIAEERRQRLERQRELQAAAERRKAGLEDDTSKNTEIESNLRGQYYFPTARKRYLPRVKLAWETIPDVEEATRSNDWVAINDLSTRVLSDCVLPMKLYANALSGGGQNLNSKFIEGMNSQASSYEQSLNKLNAAVKKKQASVVLAQLSDMREAIDKYRRLGRLESSDFGIGEVPQDVRIGSGFANNNSALYKRNKAFQGGNSSSSSTAEPSQSETSTQVAQ